MLIAGASRDELLSLARKDNSVTALTAVLDTLEQTEGVVWILRERVRGGCAYRVQFQVREGDSLNLTTVREAALIHADGAWSIDE